ncbi:MULTISPECIES: hypothetical protein [Cysteiniphilum]|uniref:Uncharacterized protein n=1 Tax=Cysteiniphilum litorale TaxID=2056700 RepID=A0A8J2Z4W2_9GAMM|nr:MULTISPECIES: hypothetical protein [Cysteiniphilum]GGF99318.1 hypothetical protein GCM10010995_15730 [Cysteiniphilum litorale]
MSELSVSPTLVVLPTAPTVKKYFVFAVYNPSNEQVGFSDSDKMIYVDEFSSRQAAKAKVDALYDDSEDDNKMFIWREILEAQDKRFVAKMTYLFFIHPADADVMNDRIIFDSKMTTDQVLLALEHEVELSMRRRRGKVLGKIELKYCIPTIDDYTEQTQCWLYLKQREKAYDFA